MTPEIEITYYTDPLCSWSWAFEPVWRRLRYELGDRLAWRYRMGGMIPDWRRYADPLNDVAAPSHVGPQWLEVSRLSGMPIEPRIWHDDPPASSYPACLAVKAAELQGRNIGERYLRRAREAVMLEQRNVARRAVLFELAAELAAEERPAPPGAADADAAPDDGVPAAAALDLNAFRRALDDGTALAAFREDLRDVKYRDIGRFPTLVIRGSDGHGVIVVGYRPYAVLRDAVQRGVGVALGSDRQPSTADYAAFWRCVGGRLTDRELTEACAPDAVTAATATSTIA